MNLLRIAWFSLLVLLACWLVLVGNSVHANEPAAKKEEKEWHESFLSTVKHSLGDVEQFADAQWRRFSRQMGFHEPRHIAAYRGYGNQDTIWVTGRLLANTPEGGPQEDDEWWDNLQDTYQRWKSHEIPNAMLELSYGNVTKKVTTDEEGYYQATFEVDEAYPRTAQVLARHRLSDRVLTAVHEIALPEKDSEFMVISDMDDTVIHTGITNLLTSARLTFLHNAKTRKPLTGVGGLYRSLARGTQSDPVNPVFYVSNSAWNMYDLLRDFVELNDLPAGPLLLRDLGLSADTSDHKISSVRNLLERYPNLPAILVGDSGQHDAQIYAEVAMEYPDRIRAIYIRDVDPEDDSEYDVNVDRIIEQSREIGVPFLRVGDSADIARHMTGLGLLPDSEMDDIRQDVIEDKARDTLAEQVQDDDPEPQAETSG